MTTISSPTRPARSRRARHIARRLLPPALADLISRTLAARRTGLPEWEYRPNGWPVSDPTTGWADPTVVSTQLARWDEFVRSVEGARPFGESSEGRHATDQEYAVHNTVMSFGYVLARAAHGRSSLSMLDWGGGIGQYSVYATALLPEVALDYHCRDLAPLAAAGRHVVPAGHFYDSDEAALSRSYDLVLASSSVHYSRDWRATLAKVASVTGRYLYVTRQPFVASSDSFVVVQRPHRHGYLTEYPGWFLNRREFLEEASLLGLDLQREFLIDERPVVAAAPEQGDYRGFLFAASARRSV